MRPYSAVRLLLAAMVTMILCACNHKQLVDQNTFMTTLRVDFDWSEAPEAMPEGMCVYFYPLLNSDSRYEAAAPDPTLPVRRFDFSGRSGGRIDLPHGRYRVMCFNNDTEAALYRNHHNFDTHEVYTRDGSIFETIYGTSAHMSPPRPQGTENERVVITPDYMWGCATVDLNVTPDGVTYSIEPYEAQVNSRACRLPDMRTILLVPHLQVCEYTYEINNVTNIGNATQMCASLTGMAGSMFLGSETLGSECVTLPATASRTGASSICGDLLTFGHHPANATPHKLVLYVWFTDGSKYYYTFDVTDQVNNAPDKRHVHLVLSGLEFPTPISDGSGFSPSVDGWSEEESDILM